ncbi:MAG: type 1 glutamine amidotransferase [Myxococcaceae bacterium]|nr:type 1 glutamine amidotransferase [Myxococcaceae bacterium]
MPRSSELEVHTMGLSHSGLGEAAAAADALILSGSPRDAWSDEPDLVRYVSQVRHWVENGKALFGVCFGHQVMARAMGGHVAKNPMGWEVGNTTVELTVKGGDSLLFASQPQPMPVLQSHQDAVVSVPAGATLLATNSHTYVQALSYGPHQYGVQFHPELTPDILRSVWAQRREVWRHKVVFDLDKRLDNMNPTPVAPHLFAQFLDPLLKRNKLQGSRLPKTKPTGDAGVQES